MPNAALLEITDSGSPAWRRRASRATFKRALEAVAVGERAVVLDILRSAKSDAFTARSITHALDDATIVTAGERLQYDSRRRGGDVGPEHGADYDLGVHPCDAAPVSSSVVTEPTGPTAPPPICPVRGPDSLCIGDGHTAAYRRTFEIKAHPKAGAPGVSAASA
mmetsp:Transcript_8017/g.21425  ORF Transcript_8017/g.21425 Transcript_8017/m.21425 type:complete len:164 (-) Transcript_8017:271-762(-)